MDLFKGMFTTIFKTSARRLKMRTEAQVRRATIGKVQAKVNKKSEEMNLAMYRKMDNVTGANKKRGQPAPGAAAGGGQATGGKPPAGAIATRQQDSAKMGKGKRNINQGNMAGISCSKCGNILQPDWDLCPYCRTPVGQAAGPAQVGMSGIPMPQQLDNSEKTMAIDLSALGPEKRSLVGWIVAQNGNHRGEDFRIFDGKNVIGTAADCDIVVTDPYLSAKHCTIRHENGNFQLIDLDSMNGSFVNQKRCRTSDLIDNDTIRLGRTEFKFKSLF